MAAHVKDALLAKFAVALDEHLSQAVVTPETSLVPVNFGAHLVHSREWLPSARFS